MLYLIILKIGVIKSRICLMMRSYYPCLFKKNEKYFTEIFKFLFVYVLEKNEKILSLQVILFQFLLKKKEKGVGFAI